MNIYARQTIPTKVKCCGLTYAVRLVPPKFLTDLMGDSPLGAVDWDGLTIYIRDDLSPSRQFIVFCHELGHVLADTGGYGDDEGEVLAQRLERPLSSLLAENDWLP